MLTDTQLINNRNDIIRALTITQRGNIDKLIQFMDESGFFILPAARKHHHNYRGGLAQHSLEVLKYLREEIKTYSEDFFSTTTISDTIILTSILHDLCKVYDYDIDSSGKISIKDNDGRHAERSIEIIKQHIILTEEEEKAILTHMGAYTMNWSFLSESYKKYPVCFILHVADMRSAYGMRLRGEDMVRANYGGSR